MKMNDPKASKPSIIEELHLTRQRLLEANGGVAGLAKFLRRREIASGVKTVIASKSTEPLQSRSR
jgi:hypothetical protein